MAALALRRPCAEQCESPASLQHRRNQPPNPLTVNGRPNGHERATPGHRDGALAGEPRRVWRDVRADRGESVSRKAVGRCREGGAGHETLLADGKLKVRDAAAVLGVSERTLFRELRAERDRKMVMPSKAPEMVS